MMHFTCRVHQTREAEREEKLRELINDNVFLRFWNNFHFRLSITLKNKTTLGERVDQGKHFLVFFDSSDEGISECWRPDDFCHVPAEFCQPAVPALAMVQLNQSMV